MFRPCMYCLLMAMILLVTGGIRSANSQPSSASDDYATRIQPIFDNRCVACHSCYNAPCQLNLQSNSGLARGATKLNVYDRSRLKSVAPSRLDIDGRSVSDWRAKSFFDVAGGTEPARTLLMQLLSLRATHPNLQPKKLVEESNFCPADGNQVALAAQSTPEIGMPYGLPPLSPSEIKSLSEWTERGAPGPSDASLASRQYGAIPVGVPSARLGGLPQWPNAAREARGSLSLRASVPGASPFHLRADPGAPSYSSAWCDRVRRARRVLMRSQHGGRTMTRAPASFYYCLSRVDGTIVDKTHIPYDLSPQKLERLRRTFLDPQWDVKNLPDYGEDRAGNPFIAFADIPVRARYQFLLDDAEYEIATFIKGPVCNGSVAVNSIQEQFFVFFLRPDADNMVTSAEYAKQAEDKLILPGVWGSDVPILDGVPFFRRLVEQREAYRKLRADGARKLRPAGYRLDDIWDGDGRNPNALLTVFRHFDTAVVMKGAVGDLPKTGFVLDYALFERLVYNLVVNYDVFGNVGHQALTRLYMDMIRMEAEELFLDFLPPSQRVGLRNSWYSGGPLTDLKLRYVFPLVNRSAPTGVNYRNAGQSQNGICRAGHQRAPATAGARSA